MDNRECILVVDDDFMNLRVVEHILKDEFEVIGVNSGEECLSYIQKTVPDMILLDLYMPDMNGFEVLERLKSDDRFKDIPVIFLTADDDKQTEVKGFQAGALDFVTKPFIAEIVRQRVNRLMELSRLQKHLEKEVRHQTAKVEERQRRIEQMSIQAVQTLARTIDAKDAYTNGHSYRVAEYSVLLAKELGWTEEEVENLRHAALLHDIGKISIPDSVLNKPMKLTNEEYNVINHIGYVAAMDNSEVNRGINAFTLGVQSVNPEATVHVTYTGAWDNKEKEQQEAYTLVKECGVDVLSYHQNQSFIVDVAEEMGVYVDKNGREI